MKSNSQSRGLVLLIVLGILSLMSVLVIAFVQMAKLERSISRNYVDQTKALLAAESGVEYAISRIQNFHGGVLRDDEWSDMLYQPHPVLTDMLLATHASFQDPSKGSAISGTVADSYGPDSDFFVLEVSDESGKINLNDSNGRWNPDEDPWFDDPEADPPTDPELVAAPGRLEKMVEALGDALFGAPSGFNISTMLFSNDPLLFRSRVNISGELFTSMDQVKDALTIGYPSIGIGPALSAAEYELLRRHVTLWSWQDPNTLRPNYQIHLVNHDPTALFPDHGFDLYQWRDFQNSTLQLEARSPVNVNTASKEVLQSLLTDVQGWFVREGPGERLSGGRYGAYGNVNLKYSYEDEAFESRGIGFYHWGWPVHKNNIIGTIKQSPRVEEPGLLAQAMWDRIHTDDLWTAAAGDGKPFSTWDEFEEWLRDQTVVDPMMIMPLDIYASYFNDIVEGRDLGYVDPVIDPNTANGGYTAPGVFGGIAIGMLIQEGTLQGKGSDDFQYNKTSNREDWWVQYMYNIQLDALLANFNPNSRLADFTPNRNMHSRVDKSHLTRYSTEFCFEPTGVFQVNSLGAIRMPTGEVVAKSMIEATVKVFETIRQTTQAQFMAGVVDIATQDQVFSLNGGTIPTAGASMGGNGYTLQSYPESIVKNVVSFSKYDGSIQLATLEASYPNEIFKESFGGAYDVYGEMYRYADPGGGQPIDYANALDTMGSGTFAHEQLDPTKRNLVTINPLTDDDPKTYPGSLYPDGVYSEIGRVPSLRTVNMMDPLSLKGSITCWTKPNFHPGITPRVHKLMTLYSKTAPLQPVGINEARQGLHTRQFSLYYFCHDVGKQQPRGHDALATAFSYIPFGDTGWDNYPGNWSVSDFAKVYSSPGMRYPQEAGFNPGAPSSHSWLNTRSFAIGWGGLGHLDLGTMQDQNVWGRNTDTVCHDFPEPYQSGTMPSSNGWSHYEGQCWNFIGFNWDMSKHAEMIVTIPIFGLLVTKPVADPIDKINIVVNGFNHTPPSALSDPAEAKYDQSNRDTFASGHDEEIEFSMYNEASFLDQDKDVNAYIRFGEVGWQDTAPGAYNAGEDWPIGNNAVLENYSADSVFDEIHSFDYEVLPQDMIQWSKEGRYYSEQSTDVYYTSPQLDIAKTLNLKTTEFARLRSVSYTMVWSQNNRNVGGSFELEANLPGVNRNPLAKDVLDERWNNGAGAGLGWDPASIDISIHPASVAAPTFQFEDHASGDVNAALKIMPAEAAGSNIRECMETAGMSYADLTSLQLGDVFQYRLYFNYDSAAGMPIFESPVLDDVTFTFAYSNTRILQWRVRRDYN